MALFFFPPGQPVVVKETPYKRPTDGSDFPNMTYVYVSSDDSWRIRDPKTGNWIGFDVMGVPESYRAQVLLLSAAYD